MATYTPNQLHQVPLAGLRPDPNQPRKYLDPVALEELTASISAHGIIEPIVCRQDGQTGLCYVVAGERRCAAARKAGLATVADLDFPSLSTEDREMVTETLTSLKTIVDEALVRAAIKKKILA